MMEEETILGGWDLHLTIQKLQAPALSGAIIAQCHNVGWQPSQEAAATVEESRVTCIANQAAESLFIAGRSRGTHDPKVKLPRNVSTLFSCTTQPWSRPEGSLLGS